MHTRLIRLGYDLPVLLIERSQEQEPWHLGNFYLPTSPHDIYVESSFEELHKIVARLQATTGKEAEPIHFKIDYQAIWRGLTGTAL